MFPVFAKMVFKKFSVPGNAMLDSNLSAIQFQLFWKHYLPLLIFTRFVNSQSNYYQTTTTTTTQQHMSHRKWLTFGVTYAVFVLLFFVVVFVRGGGGGGGGGRGCAFFSFFFSCHNIPETKHKYIHFSFFQVWHCLHLGNWQKENVARNNRLTEDTDRGTTCAVQQTGR